MSTKKTMAKYARLMLGFAIATFFGSVSYFLLGLYSMIYILFFVGGITFISRFFYIIKKQVFERVEKSSIYENPEDEDFVMMMYKKYDFIFTPEEEQKIINLRFRRKRENI